MGTTVLLWASAFVGIRAIGDSFSPGPLALGRLLVGALCLTLVAAPRRRPRPRGRTLAAIVVYGVLWFAGYNIALNAGEQHVDAGTAALLVQTGPICVAVLAGLLLGEGFPRTLVVGTAVAVCGVALISLGAESGSSPHTDGVGVVLCVLAALLYAASILAQKPVLRTVDAVQATWLGCTIGAIACLPFAPRLLEEMSGAGAQDIAWLVYLGIFPTAIAFTSWAYALARIGAGTASATLYLVPAVAVVLSWLILSETPTALGLTGGVICLVGVAVTRLRRRPAAPAAAADDPNDAAQRCAAG